MAGLRFRSMFVAGVLLALALVLAGRVLTPAVSSIAVVADLAVLGLYGVVVWLLTPKIAGVSLAIVPAAVRFGSLAGLILAGEIILEYILLPKDNTIYGIMAYGSVLAIYLWSGARVAYQTRSIRSGVLAAVWASMLAALIWVIVLLSAFYLFRGTPQQALVNQAEGNYLDFARSGMQDFDVFIMEDTMGAVFFHTLLGPLIAAILGAGGGLLGRGAAQWKS